MKILLYSLSSIRKHCTWHHRSATSFALIGKLSLLHLCASPSSTNIFLKSLIWRQQNDWSVHENILLAMTMKNKKYWKRIQTVYPCKYSGVSLICQCWHQHSLRIFLSSLWSLWWRWRFNTAFLSKCCDVKLLLNSDKVFVLFHVSGGCYVWMWWFEIGKIFERHREMYHSENW